MSEESTPAIETTPRKMNEIGLCSAISALILDLSSHLGILSFPLLSGYQNEKIYH